MKFLEHVPDDWDVIYFGGQHLNTDRHPPHGLNDYVLQPYNVNRTHAYAMRRRFIEAAHERLSQRFRARGHRKWHVDHQLGALQVSGSWSVYSPWRFLVGQAAGKSDVAVRLLRTLWWNQFPIE